jgi:hypothetical protein
MELEVNHAISTAVKVKNKWSHTSFLTACLRSVKRESFNFLKKKVMLILRSMQKTQNTKSIVIFTLRLEVQCVRKVAMHL